MQHQRSAHKVTAECRCVYLQDGGPLFALLAAGHVGQLLQVAGHEVQDLYARALLRSHARLGARRQQVVQLQLLLLGRAAHCTGHHLSVNAEGITMDATHDPVVNTVWEFALPQRSQHTPSSKLKGFLESPATPARAGASYAVLCKAILSQKSGLESLCQQSIKPESSYESRCGGLQTSGNCLNRPVRYKCGQASD